MNLISIFILIAVFITVYNFYKKVYLYHLYIAAKFSKWLVCFFDTAILFFTIYMTLLEFYHVYDHGEKLTLIIPVSSTIIIWFLVHFSDRKEIHGYFNRKESEYKKVEVRDKNKINIYPRISVITNVKGKADWETIFDSSDFYVINENFNIFNGSQLSLKTGNIIKINNMDYAIGGIQIDYLNIYDDYSLFGHTPEYKGDDTPYNMQILIEVKKTG